MAAGWGGGESVPAKEDMSATNLGQILGLCTKTVPWCARDIGMPDADGPRQTDFSRGLRLTLN